MRLKEAVSTLRLVKTELESSRKSYAELEAKHSEVLKKLLLGEANANRAVDKNDDESGGNHDGEATPSEASDLEQVRAANLRKELLEAHEAAARWGEERRAMEDEARSMRDELAALKECMVHQSQKLKEALDRKEEAIHAAEQARVRAMAAEGLAAKQETRAITAEEQLEGASNLAEIFRIRLEEMSMEKGSACTLHSEVRVGVKEEVFGEGEKSKADEEDAAELERELDLIREALTGQASSTKDSLSHDAVDESRQKAETLQAELDSATDENSKLRETLENARKESEAAGEKAAAALEESREEMKALKIGVAAAVAAREQAERIAAGERTKREKKLSSLRESVQTMRAKLAKAETETREAQKEAAEAADASSSRIAVLQARVEEAEATRDAALDARNAEVKVDPESLSAGEVELDGDKISVGTWRDAATKGREEKRRVVILQHGAYGFDICIRPCGCCQNTAVETVQDAKSEEEREPAMVIRNGDSDDVENKEEEEVKPSKKRKREDTDMIKPVAKKGKKGAKKKVFVGRLPQQIKDGELKGFFRQCGKIKSLNVLKLPKGVTTATVRFCTIAAAAKAAKMNGRELGGRTLAISKFAADLFTTVYVSNLSWSITEEAIRDTFGKCGKIKSIRFAEDRNTGQFLGCCHVEFIDRSSVGPALELKGTVMMGKPLRVEFARSRKGKEDDNDEDMDFRGSETRSPPPKQGIKPFEGTRTTFD